MSVPTLFNKFGIATQLIFYINTLEALNIYYKNTLEVLNIFYYKFGGLSQGFRGLLLS